MNMDTGARPQKADVVGELLIILPAADVFGNGVVESLNANLELQRARREFRDDFAERFGQSIRDHFEMHKKSRTLAFEEKLQDRAADIEVEVERAVDKFELIDAARQEFFETFQQRRQRNLADGNVEGR